MSRPSWSADQHLYPLAGHVHKNVSVSTSYIITRHLSVAVRRPSGSCKRVWHLASKPSFYFKQQEEVKASRVSMFCAAPVISWNTKCSLALLCKTITSESKDAQPIRLVLWHLMCRKHQSGKFIRNAFSCIQTNKSYLREADQKRHMHRLSVPIPPLQMT